MCCDHHLLALGTACTHCTGLFPPASLSMDCGDTGPSGRCMHTRVYVYPPPSNHGIQPNSTAGQCSTDKFCEMCACHHQSLCVRVRAFGCYLQAVHFTRAPIIHIRHTHSHPAHTRHPHQHTHHTQSITIHTHTNTTHSHTTYPSQSCTHCPNTLTNLTTTHVIQSHAQTATNTTAQPTQHITHIYKHNLITEAVHYNHTA